VSPFDNERAAGRPGVPDEPQYRDTETLRDRFAMAALTGMMADPNSPRAVPPAEYARMTYIMADAMLLARSAR
jgi:hypothetical protein